MWQFWARDIGWRNVVRDLPNSSLDTEPTSTQLQRPSNNTETAFIVTSFLAFVHTNENNNMMKLFSFLYIAASHTVCIFLACLYC